MGRNDSRRKSKVESLAEEIKSKWAAPIDGTIMEHDMEDYDIISLEDCDPSFQKLAPKEY